MYNVVMLHFPALFFDQGHLYAPVHQQISSHTVLWNTESCRGFTGCVIFISWAFLVETSRSSSLNKTAEDLCISEGAFFTEFNLLKTVHTNHFVPQGVNHPNDSPGFLSKHI